MNTVQKTLPRSTLGHRNFPQRDPVEEGLNRQAPQQIKRARYLVSTHQHVSRT
jgi:hypothetical protein